jgi:flagellar biosynthesis protein FlhG
MSEENSPALSAHKNAHRTIWAVGGGKGGTGKSFVSASLAIALSKRGEEVVLIDADLGGPNLHTFLGMKETEMDLGHFITNRVSSLRETLILTPFEKLSLIKGTENVLFTANLNYTSDQPVKGWVREGDSPYYRQSSIVGTITSAGFDVTILMIPDE